MSGRIPRNGLRLRMAIEMAYADDRPVGEHLARKAAEAGHVKGMTVYGLGIALQGRHEEARGWLAEAAAAGDPVGLAALVTLEVERGEEERAMTRLRSGEARFGAVGVRIALLQVWARRTVPFDARALPEGVPDPALPPSPTAHERQVARAGNSPAAWARLRAELNPDPATDSPQTVPALLALRAAEGDVAAAHAWCVTAEGGGRSDAAEGPSSVGENAGELAAARLIRDELRELCGGTVTEAAKDAIRPGTSRRVGIDTAKYLGSRAASRGDLATAQEWFERAAHEGDPEAMLYVAEVVGNRFGVARSEPLFRMAADAGSAPAMHLYAEQRRSQGQLADAERYFRRAAEAGHDESLLNLGVLLRQKGDGAGAERAYREALKSTDADTRSHARNNLANLLHDRGDTAAAQRHWRAAADAGNTMAMASLGALRAERGDLAGAEHWSRASAEGGNTTGMLNLAYALRLRGALEEAAQWLERASAAADAESRPSSPGPSATGTGTGTAAERPLDAGDIDNWTIGPD